METSQKLILPLGLVLLSIIVLFTFPSKPDFSADITYQKDVNKNQKPYPIPKISSETESEMRLSEGINRGFETAINRKDINADENPESFILRRIPPYVIKTYKTGDQFEPHTVFVRQAMIIQKSGSLADTLLHLGKNGIQRNYLDPILETESAWGYAITVLSISNEHYTDETQIFNVMLINPELEPISDEITIYWHPVKKQYLATNTFGAPGTFD